MADLAAITAIYEVFKPTFDAEYQARKTGKKVKPLFTLEDGEAVMRQLKGRKYRQRFQVVPGIEVCYRDAGHILGSCAVEAFVSENGRECKLVFSGDLGQYDTPILKDPECIESADYVLMESTYGNRRHRDRSETVQEIGEILGEVRASKGNVLIPAFALGRSQVLCMLREGQCWVMAGHVMSGLVRVRRSCCSFWTSTGARTPSCTRCPSTTRRRWPRSAWLSTRPTSST